MPLPRSITGNESILKICASAMVVSSRKSAQWSSTGVGRHAFLAIENRSHRTAPAFRPEYLKPRQMSI
jgi:hypothetical protein